MEWPKLARTHIETDQRDRWGMLSPRVAQRVSLMAYKDIVVRVRAPEETSNDFRKQRLSDFYYSWSSAAADFNNDGVLDVVSGPYIFNLIVKLRKEAGCDEEVFSDSR